MSLIKSIEIMILFRKNLGWNFKINDDFNSVCAYLQLYDGEKPVHCIARRIQSIDAPNLKCYAEKIILFWYNKLNQKFSK